MQQANEHADRHPGARRPAEPDARRLVTALAPYRDPSVGRSLAELVVTRPSLEDVYLELIA